MCVFDCVYEWTWFCLHTATYSAQYAFYCLLNKILIKIVVDFDGNLFEFQKAVGKIQDYIADCKFQNIQQKKNSAK